MIQQVLAEPDWHSRLNANDLRGIMPLIFTNDAVTGGNLRTQQPTVQQQFWLCILATNMAHIEMPLLRCENIGHKAPAKPLFC